MLISGFVGIPPCLFLVICSNSVTLLQFNISGLIVLQGEAGFYLAHQLIRRALNIPGASVHWYAKPGQLTPHKTFLLPQVRNIIQNTFLSEMRKQRKMGHITIVGSSKISVKSRLDNLLQSNSSDPKEGIAFTNLLVALNHM